MKIVKLFILMFVFLIAGIHLLIFPQEVSLWVIRSVGIWWSIEGIFYALDIIKYYLEKDT